jgi:hypothetical protein
LPEPLHTSYIENKPHADESNVFAFIDFDVEVFEDDDITLRVGKCDIFELDFSGDVGRVNWVELLCDE